MTKADFARQLGTSRARIAQLVNQGLPTEPDGSIDAAQARAWIDAHVAQVAAPTSVTYGEARRVDQVYKALMARLRFERRRAQLIDAAATRKRITERLGEIRAALDTMIARVAPQIAVESDRRAIHQLLRAEIHATLTQLSVMIAPPGK